MHMRYAWDVWMHHKLKSCLCSLEQHRLVLHAVWHQSTDTSQTCSETQDRTAASLCILTVLMNLKQVPPVTLLIYWHVCDLGQKSNIPRISNQNQCKTLHSSFTCLVAHKVRWRCSRCHCILMLLFFEPVQMKPLDTFIILWKERNIKTDHMNKWCVSAMMNLVYSISLKRLGQRRAVLRYVLFS